MSQEIASPQTHQMAEHEPSEPDGTGQARTRARPRWLLPALLSVVLTALLVASLLLWLNQRETLDEAPVTVARQEAQNFFSLDYRHADADIDRVLAVATDPFKKQYSDQRDTIKKSLTDKKLTVSATVPDNGAAIEYLKDDRAQVLVAVNAKTTAGSAGTDDNRYRARIQLTKVNGDWLVSGVNQVG